MIVGYPHQNGSISASLRSAKSFDSVRSVQCTQVSAISVEWRDDDNDEGVLICLYDTTVTAIVQPRFLPYAALKGDLKLGYDRLIYGLRCLAYYAIGKVQCAENKLGRRPERQVGR